MTPSATATPISRARLRRTTLQAVLAALLPALLPVSAAPGAAQGTDAAPAYAGQAGWLFYRHESLEDGEGSAISLGLIAKMNQLLVANGSQTLVAVVPIKTRIYAEQLPEGVTLSPSLASQYDQLQSSLRAAGVATVDLNAAFMNSPNRVGEFPFYMRQDTHWSATGAFLAAQTIQAAVMASAPHRKALEATPAAPYKLTWSTRHWPKPGDLVGQRAPGSPPIAPEMVSVFEVVRGEPSGAGLLGDAPEHGITLLGSSYSAEWTQFPAALRSALQRDVFSLSITANQGQWAGMESYLRDDAFQTHRPALLIWEMPERDMKSPPAMPYREARYVMGNQEWLLRAAAWVQQECAASPATLAIEASGLAKGSKPAQLASGLRSGASQANDFFELRFTPALERLDYLSARITSKGSTTWRMEASGPGAVTRRWTQTVAGDDAEHALKLPIAVAPEGQAFTRLKIFPGRTSGFAFQGARLCRQPASLLE